MPKPLRVKCYDVCSLLNLFFLSMATTLAYGGSHARGWIGASSLHHRHSNIWAASATYAAACSNAVSLTHWVRPEIGPASSQRLHWVSNPLNYNGNSWNLLFFFFVFLGPHTQHMEVPRLGVEWSYSCWPIPQLQQCQIWASSATYTTAHSNARSLTHWARPGTEPTTSWFLVGFISTAPQRELPKIYF